ncbi:hypothetical protein FOVG_17401 [Fusarium oxysporum f. sp. pisi HDV247]|uniref:Zn(2)-C6 fungal-type domain-containing protein n=1 Tax=Fusarium oxysporum f. sp. pisi HDV247 TaxID=1080344 RepID=W9NKK9_FUSOX|nr:hypothetical protein FOVG_17401 [Fusarium oxysporum f. sp. pisi HDV247]
MALSGLKRVSKACDRCRRHKERCDGTSPCVRCQRQGHECSFQYAGKPLGRPRKTRHDEEYAIANFQDTLDTDPAFFNVDRINALEHIVRYYSRLDHLSTENLQDIIVSLPTSQSLLSQGQRHSQERSAGQLENLLADSPGRQIQALTPKNIKGLSHSQFLRLLFDKLDNFHPGLCDIPSHTVNNQHIHLRDETALDLGSSQLLSHDKAVIEAASVFPNPETASFLMSIFFEFGQMNYFFLDEAIFRSSLDRFHSVPCTLTAQDAPGSAPLMVFAIGAQSSHIRSREKTQMDRIWLDDALALMRNSVYHGKPIAIIQPLLRNFDVLGNVDMSVKQIDTHKNIKAMVILTNMLERVWNTMSGTLDLEASELMGKLQQVVGARNQLLMYWESLPGNIFGRDLYPRNPLFRHNAYLALSYHSIHIFIGRSFILEKGHEVTISEELSTEIKSALIASCVESALATIDLCQRIKDQAGLSRSSYIEFTSCHAAVSALVAAYITN